MNIKLTKEKTVSNFCEPYIIAELGSNHNGDMGLAKKLILEAKDAGADCVKFQSWSKNTIFSKRKFEDNYFIADDYRDRTDYTLEEIVEEYSISEEELLAMKSFADSIGIDCTSTPFSKGEVDFLVDKLGSPFIKIASMDLDNYPFLDYIAKKGKPVVLSTGLSNLYEIDKAIQVIESAGNNQIVILHCVAVYPPKDQDVNLNNIKTLMQIYPDYPIGFSDHTIGTAIPLAASALGVCLIEKHFTLDKDMDGWDHKVSAVKSEMLEIVEGSKRISKALGTTRISSVESTERKNEFRRSAVVSRGLNAGAIISEHDIEFKRPGTGIRPEELRYVVGRRLVVNKKEDDLLRWEDFA